MPYPSVLSAPQKTKIRDGSGYSATPYVLANPNDIVFAAQVNQVTFSNTFAEIDFDNVNGAYGAITDVLDGFTVYVWGTSGTIPQFSREATFVGRARGDGVAGTTLTINETSSAIANDEYIIVVKDVAIREKLGRYTNKVMKVDWDITFRRLLPRVTGLKSCYVDVLSGGVADFTFPAVGTITDLNDTIATWLWDADGGAFINGTTSADAQPDIQYSSAGVYWPRVTVTGSLGNSNWFTMPVFVVSADYSDSFIFGINDLNITANIKTGYSATFNNVDLNMQNTPDGTFVAVWNIDDYNGTSTPILDDIAFVGRLRSDTPSHTVDRQYGRLQQSGFTAEGVLAQIGRIRSPKLALRSDSSPTEFGEIASMTQWRASSLVLSEFSTVTNVCSLLFDIEDNTYQNKQDNTDDNSLSVSVNKLLSGRNMGQLNQAAAGELYGARNANFISVADRNALDTIVTFTDEDTFRLSIQHPQRLEVGQITGFGGGYNTSDGTLRVLRATAPAVASLEAQNIASPLNGILLDNDQNLTDQKTEIEQITADALASKNLKDIPRIDVLDGYWFLTPSTFQWYEYAITTDDTNRDIDYSTDRFLLTDKTMRYDNELGSWTVSVTILIETIGGAAKTISQVAPGAQTIVMPNMPSLAAYPEFPALSSLYLPDGAIEEDEPAVTQGDAEIINNPIEPDKQAEKGDGGETTDSIIANVASIWSVASVWQCTNLGDVGLPNWAETYSSSGVDIVDYKYVRGNHKAYVLENDGATDTNVWNTPNVSNSIVTWDSSTTDLEGIKASLLRPTGAASAIIYGIYEQYTPSGGSPLNGLVFYGGTDDMSGDGNADLLPSDLISPHALSQNRPGTYYDAGQYFTNVWQAGTVGGGVPVNVEYAIPPGVTITRIYMRLEVIRQGTLGAGENISEISIDGVSYTTWTAGAGTGLQSITLDTGVISVADASKILFHVSAKGQASVAEARLMGVRIEFSALADFAGTRYSDDSGDTFESAISVGLMDLGDGSFDVRNGARVLAAKNEQVRRATAAGLSYDADADQGDTAGQYAKAIWLFGDGSGDDYLLAPDGGVGLYRIKDNVRTDITPNDGAADGVVLGPNSVCMSRADEAHVYGTFDFGGTVKFAYSDDSGSTWSFSAQALTSDAIYVRVKDTRTDIVAIAENTTLHYSIDGGVTFVQKTVPATGIIGVEIK